MKGLFILYHYPPIIEGVSPASSIQNLRFMSGLELKGIDYTIIRKGSGDNVEDKRVLSINSFSPRIPRAIAKHILPDLDNIPDMERFIWARKIIKQLNKIKISDYHWVHTTCSPYSNHLIGLYIKKKFGLPWIAQFYDPWVDNPYREFQYDFFRKLDKKYEAMVAEKSDIIILSNDIVKEKWIERYGSNIKNKIFILPFCTDPFIKVNKQKTINKKLILLHVGGIYGKRNLEELVKAITGLKNEIEELETKIEIRLVGSVTKSEIARINDKKLENLFHLYGKKDYSFVQSQLNSADMLLVIDSLQNNYNVHFPSKLVEYFSYQKPIIGITPKNSATNCLLQEAGHFVFHKGQSEGLKQYLKEAIYDKNPINSFNKDFYKLFHPNNVVKNYCEIINKFL